MEARYCCWMPDCSRDASSATYTASVGWLGGRRLVVGREAGRQAGWRAGLCEYSVASSAAAGCRAAGGITQAAACSNRQARCTASSQHKGCLHPSYLPLRAAARRRPGLGRWQRWRQRLALAGDPQRGARPLLPPPCAGRSAGRRHEGALSACQGGDGRCVAQVGWAFSRRRHRSAVLLHCDALHAATPAAGPAA